VAAAVSSVFALKIQRLAEAGAVSDQMAAEANEFALITFLVILGTVTVYGLAASPLAHWLKLADPNPQGVLVAGADPFARAIAAAVQEAGFSVMMVDSDRTKTSQARLGGLRALNANVVSEAAQDEIDFGGIGRLLAMTGNDEVNSLAALQFSEIFGRSEVYQLAVEEPEAQRKEPMTPRLRGRTLFDRGATYSDLSRRFAGGAVIRRTPITEEFDETAFRVRYGKTATVLFAVIDGRRLLVKTADDEIALRPGRTVISLVDSEQASNKSSEGASS
jgi:CPA1 family monovalent cation:H+ antiporter